MARVVSAAGERMATVTLTEFLLARIAEDEAAAPRRHDAMCEWSMRGDCGATEDDCDCGVTIRRARAQAECEAKRRIVEACEYAASPEFESDYDLAPRYDLADDTLRALAAIYADRDGFREEWR